MAVQVQTQANFNPIWGTDVPTITFTETNARQEKNSLQVLFISKIAGEGKEVTLRPLVCDRECDGVKKFAFIAEKKLLVGLEYKDGQLKITLNEGRKGMLKLDSEIFVEFQGKKVSLGTVTQSYTVNEDAYKEIYIDKALVGYLSLVYRMTQQ